MTFRGSVRVAGVGGNLTHLPGTRRSNRNRALRRPGRRLVLSERSTRAHLVPRERRRRRRRRRTGKNQEEQATTVGTGRRNNRRLCWPAIQVNRLNRVSRASTGRFSAQSDRSRRDHLTDLQSGVSACARVGSPVGDRQQCVSAARRAEQVVSRRWWSQVGHETRARPA